MFVSKCSMLLCGTTDVFVCACQAGMPATTTTARWYAHDPVEVVAQGGLALQVQVPNPAREKCAACMLRMQTRQLSSCPGFLGSTTSSQCFLATSIPNSEANVLVFRRQPVVFMVRDHAEMGHFLTVQLAPPVVVSPQVVLLLM